jgi:hypothetical protein
MGPIKSHLDFEWYTQPVEPNLPQSRGNGVPTVRAHAVDDSMQYLYKELRPGGLCDDRLEGITLLNIFERAVVHLALRAPDRGHANFV